MPKVTGVKQREYVQKRKNLDVIRAVTPRILDSMVRDSVIVTRMPTKLL